MGAWTNRASSKARRLGVGPPSRAALREPRKTGPSGTQRALSESRTPRCGAKQASDIHNPLGGRRMKAITRRRSMLMMTFATAVFAATGCGSQVEGTGQDPVAASPRLMTSGVKGELLHTITPAEGHTIKFYKLLHCPNAVLETHPFERASLTQ